MQKKVTEVRASVNFKWNSLSKFYLEDQSGRRCIALKRNPSEAHIPFKVSHPAVSLDTSVTGFAFAFGCIWRRRCRFRGNCAWASVYNWDEYWEVGGEVASKLGCLEATSLLESRDVLRTALLAVSLFA